jgi:PAS domain S-box-containing protein
MERRFRAIVDMAPDAIVVADRDGYISLVNRQTEVLFGYAREQLLGQPVEMLIPERFQMAHQQHRAAYTAAPHIRPMGANLHLFGRRRDGSEFPVEVSLSPLEGESEFAVIASIRDVTALQRIQAARAAAEAANAELGRLQALTDTALSHLALDDLLRELLDRIGSVMGVEDVGILLLDADGQQLRMRAARGLEHAVAIGATVPVGQGIVGRVAATRAPLVVDDLAAYPVFYAQLRETGQSAAGVPLLVEERLVGVLYVGSAFSRRFTEADVQLLQRAADRIALAIDRASAYEAAQAARVEAERQAEQLDRIFEAVADALIVYDARGRIVRMNAATRGLLGLDAAPTGYFQLSLAERHALYERRDEQDHPLAPEDLPAARALRGETLTGANAAEGRMRTLDGREIETTTTAAPLRESDGHLVGAVAILRDITERKRLLRQREEALQRSEAWFHVMADTAPVLLWVADSDALVTFVNAPWLEFTGRRLEQELGNGWAESVHPDDYARCLQTYLTAFRDRQPFTMEYRLRRFDGEYRWLVDNGVPRYMPDGSFAGYIGSAIDITEHKRLERALQASQARYRDLVESQMEMICRYLPDTTLTFVNEAYCRRFGRPREELLGRKFLDLIDEAARDHHEQSTAALLMHPNTAVDEHEVMLPDGSIGWQQWVDHPIFDAEGQVVEIQAIGRDITDLKRAEAALRESEARFRAAFESAAIGMALVGLDGHPLEVNHALVEMLGYAEEEMRTHAFAEFTVPEDIEPNLTLFQQAVAGDIERYHVEKRYLHKDGHLVWGHMSAGVVRDAAGKPLYLVNHVQDITKRKQAEEALQASEARYRMVVRNLPQTVVLLFDAELRHTFADGPGLQALGLTPEGLEGRTVWETLPSDLAAALAHHYEAARSGQAAELDVEHAQRIYRIQVVPMPATTTAPSAQTPVGMVVLQDVTEQRRARDELVRERTRADMLGALGQEFQTLAEHSPDLIARLDPVGRLLYVNPAGADLLGRPPGHWTGKTIAELGVLEDISRRWAQRQRDVVETRAPQTFDGEVQASDGRMRSLHVRYIPELAEDGALQSVLAIATDVTALKQAEARLAEQASELGAIFEAQADVVIVYDKHRRFVRGNPAWEQFLQRTIDLHGLSTQPAFNALTLADQVDWLNQEVQDEHGRDILDEDRPAARALRGEIITGAHAVDERLQSADGRDMQISVTAAPIRDRAGQITGAVLVGRDVTERRQLERQVVEQASELEAIFEAQADGVAVYDLQGSFVRTNTALRRLLGFDADADYTARPLEERARRLVLFDEQGQVLTPEQWPHWRVLRGEILAGASAMEGRVRTVDGRELWISITGAPVRRPDGQVTGTVLITRDVTARRALERQVAEQAAAAERTRLAHELHDTVTQDIYSAGLLAESITRNWPEHRAEAEVALEQLPRVIRGALAGLRMLLLELRPTALNQLPLSALLHQLGEAMSTRAKVPIDVRIQGSDRARDGVNNAAEPSLPPEVKLVFYRVAQEALMNAAKYARARAINVKLRTRGRGMKGTIELEIADDGQGFDPIAIPAGHFGLAMMRERTQAVGAPMQVHSQPGQGTQIVVAWQGGATGHGGPPEGGNS